jgi:uncharacterized SAM-binding protein YcdF (DUF218 family)
VVALITLTPLTEWVAQPLYIPTSSISRADAIVVMEAWAFEDGELNESGVQRVLRAADLYHSAVASIVVVTGKKASPARTGSALQPMANLLTRSGVPSQSVLIEDASSNTYESAVHVAAIARSRGWQYVALVTDASHMRRAAASFRKQGVDVAYAPVLVWHIGGARPSLRLARAAMLVHEYGGLLYYRSRGWI